MSHKYYITYLIERHPSGLSQEEVMGLTKDKDIGACDNIILISLMGTPGKNEGLSTIITSMTGEDDGELTDDQMFIVWAVWTAALAKSKTLSLSKRDLCKAVHYTIRSALGVPTDCGCVMDKPS